MNLLVVLLTSCLVGTTLSCSCLRRRYNAEMCDDRVQYIIKVTVEEDLTPVKQQLVDDKEEDTAWPSLVTDPLMTTTTSPMYFIRTVRARILQFYKGKGEVGSSILLSSGTMDSMCGIGNWLDPGTSFALSTNDLSKADMGLCSFNFVVDGWEWDRVEPVLKNHDCDCKLQECRLRENRRVLRGMCKDPAAYCAKDERRKCRWYNAESIDSCMRSPYW